jgi:hypothetical protein
MKMTVFGSSVQFVFGSNLEGGGSWHSQFSGLAGLAASNSVVSGAIGTIAIYRLTKDFPREEFTA